MYDFGNSRTIPSLKWKKINQKLNELNVSDYCFTVDDRKIIKDKFNKTANDLRDWLNPIVNLSSLPHHYYTNGIHGAIEQWLASESRQIYCLRGEYPYPMHLRKECSEKRKVVIVDNVKDIPEHAVVYMSNPFSSTGRWDERYEEIENPIALDIAFVGTTGPYNFKIRNNVEQVFWSVSKPFGLGHFRAGIRFSRFDEDLHNQITDLGYLNVLGSDIINLAINQYGVVECWDKLKSMYDNICSKNNFLKSDSYLVATTNNDHYSHLKREDGTIRLPIAKILKDKQNGMD